MKKLILAALILLGSGMTADAQKFTQPNPVKEQSNARNPVLFKEKVAKLTTVLNLNDEKGAQVLMSDLVAMMMYRGDELVKAKAPKAESDSKYNMSRQLKTLSNDVMGNKTTIINLLKQAEAAY